MIRRYLIGISRRAFDVAYQPRPVPIRHIAPLHAQSSARLRDFYCNVLYMKEVERTDRSSDLVSDGYFTCALVPKKRKSQGLNQFGFMSKVMRNAGPAEKAGVRAAAPIGPARKSLRRIPVHDPEGQRHRYLAKGVACLIEALQVGSMMEDRISRFRSSIVHPRILDPSSSLASDAKSSKRQNRDEF